MGYEERRVAAELGRGQGAHPVDDWAISPTEPVATVRPDATPADQTARAAPKGRPLARAVREVVETLLLALVIFVGVRLVVLNFRVDGGSMEPNLDNRQMLLVNRNAYAHFDLNRLLNVLPGEDREGERVVYPFDPPERGDIVVFEPPVDSDKPYIKRVIGLPGERVTFRDGSVYINGAELEEPYIDGPITECDGGKNCHARVAEGEVFVLGDNRDNSSDSRSFGPVAVEDIVGKAWFSYWPIDDVGLVPHYDYPEIADAGR